MENQGWLKIPRDIVCRWLWKDITKLQWWLDLILMANEKDMEVVHDTHKFILKRGQILASPNDLAKRWRVSRPTVVKYLSFLESKKMISRANFYTSTCILTICNYASYGDGVYTLSYTLKEKEQEKEKIPPTSPFIKEKEKEKEIAVDNMCAYAYEDMGESWTEVMCMRWHISAEELRKLYGQFLIDCCCNGNEDHKNLGDIKSHFNSWLRIRENNNGNKKQQTNADKRKGVDASYRDVAEYGTSF